MAGWNSLFQKGFVEVRKKGINHNKTLEGTAAPLGSQKVRETFNANLALEVE